MNRLSSVLDYVLWPALMLAAVAGLSLLGDGPSGRRLDAPRRGPQATLRPTGIAVT